MGKKIFIGADHNGFKLKEHLEHYLRSLGYDVNDVSGNKLDVNDDFPIHASRVATSVLGHNDSLGILLCGSGQGVAMAANRYKGIRASLIWNESEARSSRNDDDANVLCLPAREITNLDDAKNLVNIWLNTPFDGAIRFVRRIKELDNLT
jgi:ribose 5-phosphate isomerase B